MNENKIGTIIVDNAVRLQMELGLGLLESVYEVVKHYRSASKSGRRRA